MLANLGVYSPAVVVGDRYAPLDDLSGIDELLGLDSTVRGLLSFPELTSRAERLLTAAGRYASQVPPEHYLDLLPGARDGVSHTYCMYRRDGSPFMFHQTTIGVVCRIVGRGEKFRYFVRPGRSGVPELDFVSHLGEFAVFGEPEAATPMPLLIAAIDEVARDIGTVDSVRHGIALGRRVDFSFGQKSIHEFLQMMTYALLQHTRQLMAIVSGLSIEPDGEISEREFEGLEVPAQIFD